MLTIQATLRNGGGPRRVHPELGGDARLHPPVARGHRAPGPRLAIDCQILAKSSQMFASNIIQREIVAESVGTH